MQKQCMKPTPGSKSLLKCRGVFLGMPFFGYDMIADMGIRKR